MGICRPTRSQGYSPSIRTTRVKWITRFLDISARRMSATGFKILVDLISSSPRPVRLGEVPFRFGKRAHGESKLESTVLVDYLFLIVDKLVGDFIPLRFVLFVCAGLGGTLLHLGILGALYQGRGMEFVVAQAIATLAAMTLNFLLNNWLTFRDRETHREQARSSEWGWGIRSRVFMRRVRSEPVEPLPLWLSTLL